MDKRTLYVTAGAVAGAAMAWIAYTRSGGSHGDALRVAGIVASIVSLFA